jgi:hypothetical protein
VAARTNQRKRNERKKKEKRKAKQRSLPEIKTRKKRKRQTAAAKHIHCMNQAGLYDTSFF